MLFIIACAIRDTRVAAIPAGTGTAGGSLLTASALRQAVAGVVAGSSSPTTGSWPPTAIHEYA